MRRPIDSQLFRGLQEYEYLLLWPLFPFVSVSFSSPLYLLSPKIYVATRKLSLPDHYGCLQQLGRRHLCELLLTLIFSCVLTGEPSLPPGREIVGRRLWSLGKDSFFSHLSCSHRTLRFVSVTTNSSSSSRSSSQRLQCKHWHQCSHVYQWQVRIKCLSLHISSWEYIALSLYRMFFFSIIKWYS